MDDDERLVSLLNNFPFDELRPQQGKILEEIASNWDDKKYFFIDAPTGVGKSAIALAIAQMSKKAFFLTSTKALQDQYMNDFNISNIKGRGNYTCNVNPNFKVDGAPCMVDKNLLRNCKSNNVCNYYTAVDRALASNAFITSYSYFVRSVEWGILNRMDKSGKRYANTREVIIADEAHEMEQIITDYISMDISVKTLLDHGVKLPENYQFEDINSVDDKEAIEKLADAIELRYDEQDKKLFNTMNNSISWAGGSDKISKVAAQQIEDLKKKVSALRSIHSAFNFFRNNLQYDWLVERNAEEKSIRLAPLSAGPAFHRFLKPLAEKVVFMSASLGDKKTVYRELGIKESECVWISTGTPFDPKKGPVFSISNVQLSKGKFDENLEQAIESVVSIMETHDDKKGIIHAGNYKLTKAILEQAPHHVRRRLIGKGSGKGQSNEDLISKHTRRQEPTVLVSPSMISGVDLKGDLSSFQVIVKLPWGNLGDPWVKAKTEMDNSWYTNDMIRRLVQACGRSVRTEEDEAETYILDSSFKWIWNTKKHMFPAWFKERVIT